jgi:hypothetical protein
MLIEKVSALVIMCLLLAACGSGSGSSGAGETKSWSHLQAISFAADSTTIIIGNSRTIVASTGEGSGAITYTSSDSSIASVSASGLITANALGSATITATKAADSTYSEASATTSITVDPLNEQTISFANPSFSIELDTAQTVSASGVEGTGAISYTSSDENVVTVSSDGLVTAIAVGSAEITVFIAADSEYLEATASITVTVEAMPIALDAPVISVRSSGNARAMIAWGAIGNAAGYNLYVAKESIDSADNYASLTGGELTLNVTSPYSLTGLDNGQSYYFAVTASAGADESDLSNELTVVPKNPLNDTGIVSSGGGTSGSNETCTTAINNGGHVPQDCDQGRDADLTLTKVGAGVAAFDFTKIASDGSALTVQGGAWAVDGSEAAGTRWSCVRDNVTGLVWEMKTEADAGIHATNAKVVWADRNLLADATNTEALCGIQNWRVPTVVELATIVNANRLNPALDIARFPNGAGSHWASNPVAGDGANGWVVNFFAGIPILKGKTLSMSQRLVSGSYQANDTSDDRYTVNDGTVTDGVTGLMWKQCPEGLSGDDCSVGAVGLLIWGGSMKRARDAEFAGYSDWRLPNMKELLSIVAFDQSSPAINTTVFPGSTLSFWSSSHKVPTGANAYVVDFTKGIHQPKVRTSQKSAQRLVRDAD